MSTCNYCVLKRMRRRAKDEKKKVTLKHEHGGMSVLVNGKYVVWLMELPNKCDC